MPQGRLKQKSNHKQVITSVNENQFSNAKIQIYGLKPSATWIFPTEKSCRIYTLQMQQHAKTCLLKREAQL